MIIKFNNYLLFKPKTSSKLSKIYYIGSKRIILKYNYDSIPNIVLYCNYKKDIYIHFSKQFDFIEAKMFKNEICSERYKIPDFISVAIDFRNTYNQLLKC